MTSALTNVTLFVKVCFSMFSPISHLRFWSVMVIVTATPPIVFFAYASHIITRHGGLMIVEVFFVCLIDIQPR